MEELLIGDLLTLEDGKYIVLDQQAYNGDNYIFTNKMTEYEDPTEECFVFKYIDGELEEINDKQILERLLPTFSNNVQKMAYSNQSDVK